jgi:hypothetical protein
LGEEMRDLTAEETVRSIIVFSVVRLLVEPGLLYSTTYHDSLLGSRGKLGTLSGRWYLEYPCRESSAIVRGKSKCLPKLPRKNLMSQPMFELIFGCIDSHNSLKARISSAYDCTGCSPDLMQRSNLWPLTIIKCSWFFVLGSNPCP